MRACVCVRACVRVCVSERELQGCRTVVIILYTCMYLQGLGERWDSGNTRTHAHTCTHTHSHTCTHSHTVDPRLSGYNGTRPWPDKRNSRICESSCKQGLYCIINSTVVSFPVMLSIVGANNHHISASSGFEHSKFQHLRVFQQSRTTTLLRAQHGC